jgi:hypothetical protein
MRDFYMTQDILAAVGWGYLILSATVLGLALWLPKRRNNKLIAGALALGLVAIWPIYSYRSYQQADQAAFKIRYDAAKALFDERCKTAGEKIYRTVEDVEGVYLVNLRTEPMNYGDQYKLDDPYGYPGNGDSYIRLFISGRSTVPVVIGQRILDTEVVTYKYVETPTEDGIGFYHYTTDVSKHASEHIRRSGGGTITLIKKQITKRNAKYGVVWADISTKSDRDSWIAGGSLKIIDLATNEVLGEQIGYMLDPGLGSTGGGRSPWSKARHNSCPELNEKKFHFFDRVVKPIQEK